jgi:regulator of RNase E activity RraB
VRRLLEEHVTNDTREQLAKRAVEQLELSGFEIDEGEQVMRKRDRGRGW